MATALREFFVPLLCPPSTSLTHRGTTARACASYPHRPAPVTRRLAHFAGGERRRWDQRQPWSLYPIFAAKVEEKTEAEVEVARGYTITQLCDEMIQVFLEKKTSSEDRRKLLAMRDEWNKYSESFYRRLHARHADEMDAAVKQRLYDLAQEIRKIDEELEGYSGLLEEIQQSPGEIDAIVARRRREFSGDFFHHITDLAETSDSLEDRDAMARLGARCLAAVSAYDNALQSFVETQDAQSKLDEILNSSSVEMACEKVQSLVKAQELDSSLILLINQTWAAARDSKTVRPEAKRIMWRIYRAAQKSLTAIAPPEIKLLKRLLNIADPEARFSALATAFCPGDEREAKDPRVIYSTPQELHKWIQIIMEAHQLNKEGAGMRGGRIMAEPILIQRLFVLKETIEEEYLNRRPDHSAGP